MIVCAILFAVVAAQTGSDYDNSTTLPTTQIAPDSTPVLTPPLTPMAIPSVPPPPTPPPVPITPTSAAVTDSPTMMVVTMAPITTITTLSAPQTLPSTPAPPACITAGTCETCIASAAMCAWCFDIDSACVGVGFNCTLQLITSAANCAGWTNTTTPMTTTTTTMRMSATTIGADGSVAIDFAAVAAAKSSRLPFDRVATTVGATNCTLSCAQVECMFDPNSGGVYPATSGGVDIDFQFSSAVQIVSVILTNFTDMVDVGVLYGGDREFIVQQCNASFINDLDSDFASTNYTLRALLGAKFGVASIVVRSISSATDATPAPSTTTQLAGIYAGIGVGACVLGACVAFAITMLATRRQRRAGVDRSTSRSHSDMSAAAPLAALDEPFQSTRVSFTSPARSNYGALTPESSDYSATSNNINNNNANNNANNRDAYVALPPESENERARLSSIPPKLPRGSAIVPGSSSSTSPIAPTAPVTAVSTDMYQSLPASIGRTSADSAHGGESPRADTGNVSDGVVSSASSGGHNVDSFGRNMASPRAAPFVGIYAAGPLSTDAPATYQPITMPPK